MKCKILLTIVVSLVMGSLFAQTHYPEKKSVTIYNPNHILFSPLYFFDGTFMITYERLFSSGSLRITPSIKLQNLDDQRYTQKEGFGLDLGYKFFFTNRPYRANFYLGPYALYKNIKAKSPTYPYYSSSFYPSTESTTYIINTYNIIGMGVDTGIKFILGRFTMDISLGGGIRYAYLDGNTFESSGIEWYDIDYKGIVPRGNFSIGIAF